jgi:hypothetical protein
MVEGEKFLADSLAIGNFFFPFHDFTSVSALNKRTIIFLQGEYFMDKKSFDSLEN